MCPAWTASVIWGFSYFIQSVWSKDEVFNIHRNTWSFLNSSVRLSSIIPCDNDLHRLITWLIIYFLLLTIKLALKLDDTSHIPLFTIHHDTFYLPSIEMWIAINYTALFRSFFHYYNKHSCHFFLFFFLFACLFCFILPFLSYRRGTCVYFYRWVKMETNKILKNSSET